MELFISCFDMEQLDPLVVHSLTAHSVPTARPPHPLTQRVPAIKVHRGEITPAVPSSNWHDSKF